tara:strand:- start:1197 stop:1736 length:540 start_codon:yes stop_codon:yes gene_type:complete
MSFSCVDDIIAKYNSYPIDLPILNKKEETGVFHESKLPLCSPFLCSNKTATTLSPEHSITLPPPLRRLPPQQISNNITNKKKKKKKKKREKHIFLSPIYNPNYQGRVRIYFNNDEKKNTDLEDTLSCNVNKMCSKDIKRKLQKNKLITQKSSHPIPRKILKDIFIHSITANLKIKRYHH